MLSLRLLQPLELSLGGLKVTVDSNLLVYTWSFFILRAHGAHATNVNDDSQCLISVGYSAEKHEKAGRVGGFRVTVCRRGR